MACQPKWAAMKRVFGLRANRRLRCATSSSKVTPRVSVAARPGKSASSSQRSLWKSCGAKKACGSAVWMNTGMSRRAAACQIGSSSGSSTFRREPSAFWMFRPNPLEISPTPTAPAATSASSCFTARSAQPGPT